MDESYSVLQTRNLPTLKSFWIMVMYVQVIGFHRVYSRCFHNVTSRALKQAIVSHENYPQKDYPSNFSCTWLIKTSRPADRIVLEIDEFDLYSSDCRFDYLQIYEESMSPDKLLSTLCGHRDQGDVLNPNSDTVYLQFKTDSNKSDKGFRIYVYSVPAPPQSPIKPGTTPSTKLKSKNSKSEIKVVMVPLFVGLGILIVTIVVCTIFVSRHRCRCHRTPRSSRTEPQDYTPSQVPPMSSAPPMSPRSIELPVWVTDMPSTHGPSFSLPQYQETCIDSYTPVSEQLTPPPYPPPQYHSGPPGMDPPSYSDERYYTPPHAVHPESLVTHTRQPLRRC